MCVIICVSLLCLKVQLISTGGEKKGEREKESKRERRGEGEGEREIETHRQRDSINFFNSDVQITFT